MIYKELQGITSSGSHYSTAVRSEQASGRAQGSGVFVEAGSNHFIGGTAPGSGNVIAFNRNGGVVTSPGAEVAILGNSIFDNLAGAALGGIDLGYDGLSPNDACDADAGVDNRQNFPVLASAVSSEGALDVAFTLESAPNRT